MIHTSELLSSSTRSGPPSTSSSPKSNSSRATLDDIGGTFFLDGVLLASAGLVGTGDFSGVRAVLKDKSICQFQVCTTLLKCNQEYFFFSLFSNYFSPGS